METSKGMRLPLQQPLPWNHVFVVDEPSILVKGSCKVINLPIGLRIKDVELFYIYYLLPLLQYLSSVPYVMIVCL